MDLQKTLGSMFRIGCDDLAAEPKSMERVKVIADASLSPYPFRHQHALHERSRDAAEDTSRTAERSGDNDNCL